MISSDSSREDKILSEGGTIPDIRAGLGSVAYLFDAFKELGKVNAGVDGISAISWSEMYYYSECTLSVGEPWEFRMLRAMSFSYIQGLRHGENLWAKEPVSTE